MATAREILVAKSGYPVGTSTARERMKALSAGVTYVNVTPEKVVTKILKASNSKTTARVRLPHVTVLDNSPQSLQQAIDDVMRNVQRELSK